MGRLISDIRIKNKKAGFDFFLLEKYVAGIVLTGTEIKSIRDGKASINEAFCSFVDGELYIRNMHIAEYTFGNYLNHDPRRPRKLLLNKRELSKCFEKVQEKGLTLIPVVLFIDGQGRAKIEIALAKGKVNYDKRQTLKEKDIKREMQRGSSQD